MSNDKMSTDYCRTIDFRFIVFIVPVFGWININDDNDDCRTIDFRFIVPVTIKK